MVSTSSQEIHNGRKHVSPLCVMYNNAFMYLKVENVAVYVILCKVCSKSVVQACDHTRVRVHSVLT